MIIHVTQKHIDSGHRNCCSDCPTVLGLNEVTGKEWIAGSMSVSYKCTDPKNFGWSKEIQLPSDVCERITKYDFTGQMEPFSFELDIPQ